MEKFKNEYNINEGMEIPMDNLMAILLYCNTNELQSVFSSTYRRLVKIDESDEDFKLRHGYYHHFGRLLREVVEVFGTIWTDDNFVLYHGIDHALYFKKMIAKFYSPTSTTMNQMIAAQFAGMFLRGFIT